MAYNEGDECPNCGEGELGFVRPVECSCHISAPCFACTDAPLECDECGWNPEADDA